MPWPSLCSLSESDKRAMWRDIKPCPALGVSRRWNRCRVAPPAPKDERGALRQRTSIRLKGLRRGPVGTRSSIRFAARRERALFRSG